MVPALVTGITTDDDLCQTELFGPVLPVINYDHFEDAVREGTHERLRPIVMTALMAALGLLPAALSRGVGAETTRPFATVIVGGLATATSLTLLLLPVLYRLFHEGAVDSPRIPSDSP